MEALTRDLKQDHIDLTKEAREKKFKDIQRRLHPVIVIVVFVVTIIIIIVVVVTIIIIILIISTIRSFLVQDEVFARGSILFRHECIQGPHRMQAM